MTPEERSRMINGIIAARRNSPKIKIWQGADRDWYWHLKAANGETVCQGEGYATEAGARAGVERIRANFERIRPGSF